METEHALREAIREFGRRFGGAAPRWVASSPGRVNLIGEHVDYCDGLVLPAAIDLRIAMAAGPDPGRSILLTSAAMPEPAAIDLREPPAPGLPRWANGIRGVVAGFRERGVGIPGMRIAIASDLPSGAGLSSSAALQAAMAVLVAEVTGHRPPPGEIERLCQDAERKFAGVPCGIMDQTAVLRGRKDCALLIDCRSLETEAIPLLRGLSLVVFDTTVTHDLADGEYAQRRAACEAAARTLGIPALRDLPPDRLDDASRALPAEAIPLVRHVVAEIDRTRRAADALRTGDLRALDRLFAESHASLRDDFRVSCPELDAVVDLARHRPGIVACRMTGGGFGGSAIVLAESAGAAEAVDRLADDWRQRTGRVPRVRFVAAGDGARAASLTP